MAFTDYSSTPASNTTIGDNIFIGPQMERAKVRPALQQLAADGKALDTFVRDTIAESDFASTTYYPTIAAGIAATAVGAVFKSDELGALGFYAHIAAAPYYNFVGAVPVAGDVVFNGAGAVASGVLFDTDGADNFTDLIYTPNGALTVTDAQAAFSNSGAAISVTMEVPASDGSKLNFCFDHWTVEATFTVTSFPAIDAQGATVAARSYVPGVQDSLFGMNVKGHFSDATKANVAVETNNSAIALNGVANTLPATVAVKYHHDGTNFRIDHVTTVNGVASAVTTAYTTGSFAPPNLFYTGALRFERGVLTCTKLKLSADYPNAKFAFLGDSLTYGSSATPLSNAFASRVRAAYPGQVLIAGAAGSTTTNWESIIDSVCQMKPRFAFICLGTNDRNNGLTVAASQASMTIILNALTAANITPILLSSPPIGNANVPTFNTWLAGLGHYYIDIYTTLLGTGTSLSAGYDSGDHVHWNNAGHAAVYTQIMQAIDALGLADLAPSQVLIDTDTTLAANSDQRIPTQAAVKAYVDAGIAAVPSGYQPLDSDLTAIAALTTTSFGRGLLTASQLAAVADLTTTATTGSLPTPNGAITIANAATPTNLELQEYCVELEAKVETILARLRTFGVIAP